VDVNFSGNYTPMYQNVLKTLTICVIYEMVKTHFEQSKNYITNTGTIFYSSNLEIIDILQTIG